jgi:hypothetical protein
MYRMVHDTSSNSKSTTSPISPSVARNRYPFSSTRLRNMGWLRASSCSFRAAAR